MESWLLIAFIVLGVGGFLYFQSVQPENKNVEIQTTIGELQRTIPLEINSREFEVTYSTNRAGMWGVIIIDSVSGGCKFPAGTGYKSVMLNGNTNSQTVIVTAPSSGSCTFSGDYNFGEESIKNFEDQTVIIK